VAADGLGLSGGDVADDGLDLRAELVGRHLEDGFQLGLTLGGVPVLVPVVPHLFGNVAEAEAGQVRGLLERRLVETLQKREWTHERASGL
jgi:hypothetical protein